MGDHECHVHYEPDDRSAPIVNEAPDHHWTAEEWHQDSTGDTGTSHSLVGRRYVIACEWCRCVFIAESKAKALARFRSHEREMTEAGRIGND